MHKYIIQYYSAIYQHFVPLTAPSNETPLEHNATCKAKRYVTHSTARSLPQMALHARNLSGKVIFNYDAKMD